MVTEIIGELEGKGKALNQYSRFNDLPGSVKNLSHIY